MNSPNDVVGSLRRDGPVEEPARPAIPDIELIKPIGRGAFGEVWLGEERMLPGVFRAVKIVRHRIRLGPPERHDGLTSSDPGSTDHAARELFGVQTSQSRAARHPHLVEILRVGRLNDASATDPPIFYVMEAADHIGGPQPFRPSDYRPLSLDALLRAHGPLAPLSAAAYARQILAALEYLHANQVHHHDVKPSNLLFVRGHLKLGDLGLAGANDGASGGTRAYCPPESSAPDDLYATGIVLYEMLTGLSADRFPEWPASLRADSAPFLREVRHVMSRACEREPSRRFATPRAFAHALAEATTVAPSAVRPGWRKRTAWATVVLLAWAGSLWLMQNWMSHSPAQVTPETYGTAPFDGSVQVLSSGALPDGSQIELTRKVGREAIRIAWPEYVGTVEVFDLQIRFESPTILCVAGGYRMTLANNSVALSVSEYDPSETGFVMQLWLVLLGPDGEPADEQDAIELLYYGQPEAEPGTDGRFFDHVPIPPEFAGPLRLVIASTMAVNLQLAIDEHRLGAVLEPEHYQDVAVLMRRVAQAGEDEP